jgi:aminopeptidase N
VEVAFGDNLTPLAADLPSNNWDSHRKEVRQLTFTALDDVTAAASPATGEFAVGLAASSSPGFVVNQEDHKLLITLPRPLKDGEHLVVRTLTVAHPDAVTLEGAYLDYTPEGQPQTIITQMQQYGFQRLVPAVDQMTTKCCYTTTITADARYTNILCNGDLAQGYYDEAAAAEGRQVPRPHAAGPYRYSALAAAPTVDRVTLRYDNWIIPMATYLFFLGTGTYTTYSKRFEYPDGKMFQLELLVFPGLVTPINAARKLKMMDDAVLFMYLNLGAQSTEMVEERARVLELIAERDALLLRAGRMVAGRVACVGGDKYAVQGIEEQHENGQVVFRAEDEAIVGAADGKLTAAEEARLAAIRSELKSLIAQWKETGYQYTGAVYREIAMQASSYGGMENTGNTTIVAKAIAQTDYTSDRELQFMVACSAHEFGHSINGSEVTGDSPFSLFLNEAVTVQTYERLRCDAVFGADFMRLSQVSYALTPSSGPLAIDEMPGSMSVVPAGFNTTLELISAMTYSKAPEFVNMVKDVIGGQAVFDRSLATYYKRYKNSNATPAQWLACMEEGGGRSLEKMAEGWLRRSGHPRLHYTTSYDADKGLYRIHLRQTGFEGRGDGSPWEFPVSWSANKGAKVLAEGMYIMSDAEAVIEAPVEAQPDFASVGRNWSFFGRVICDEDSGSDSIDPESALAKQALNDVDAVNRMLAYRALADRERVRCVKQLLQGRVPEVSAAFVTLTSEILFDETLSPATRQLMLTAPDTVDDPALQAHYWAIADARCLMYAAVVAKHHARVVALLREMDAHRGGEQAEHMASRALKGLLVTMLVSAYAHQVADAEGPLVAPEMDLPAFLVSVLRESAFMTDKINATSAMMQLKASDDIASIGAVNKDYDAITADPEVSALLSPADPVFFPSDVSLLRPRALVNSADKARCLTFAKNFMMKHPDGMSTWFALASSTPEGVAAVTSSKGFRVELPDHARTVARQWAAQRRLSLLTVAGLAATKALLIKVASVNEMSAAALVQACGDVSKFPTAVRTAVLDMLKSCHADLTAKGKQSITKGINAMIEAGEGTKQ